MQRVALVCLSVFILAGGIACSNDDTMDCNLSTPAYTGQSAGTAAYLATASGNADIARVVYGGAAGPDTVNNPQLPLNLFFNVPQGTSVFITATGQVNHGSIHIQHTFAGAGSETNQFERNCAN